MLSPSEFYLLDPLVRTTVAITEAVEEAVATVLLEGETTLSQELHDEAVTKLQGLVLFAEDCQYVYAPVDTGLEHLIEHFGAFCADIAVIEVLLSELKDAQADAVLRGVMEPTRLRLAALGKRTATVTERHIALQTHFQELATDVTTPEGRLLITERYSALAGLSVLRDEYFTKPRRGLIAEYLELATTVDEELRAEFGPRIFERLDEVTVKLEVYSLIESLEANAESA